MDNYDDYEEEMEESSSEVKLLPILGLVSTWFIRIGMGIGVILLFYYLITGKVVSALLFILGLVVAFFFGYFLMFCIDKFMSAE